jgi:hypothetical protein
MNSTILALDVGNFNSVLGWFKSATPEGTRERRVMGRTPGVCDAGLLLAQHKVHNPTSADMRLLRVAAVVEDVVVVAPGVLKGVGQDRHRGKLAGVVHLLRE